MTRNTLVRLSLALCAAVALMLAGCGGDDGVNPTTHMDVEDERDMYKAQAEQLQTDLTAATAEVTRLTGELDTATGNVTRLTGELNTANMDLTTANGEVTRLMGELATANDEVTRLTGELATVNMDLTTANDEVTRLTGELATANGEVTRLTGELATANMDLTTANGEVTRLTGELDTATKGLTAANAEVMRLTTEIEGDGTDANPGLRQQLADAMARIAALEGGTAPDVLDPIKKAASDAADAASTAAMAARAASDAAMTAAMNRATIQTGEANSAAHAMYADMHADTAESESGKAATASQMAQDAMDAATATPQRLAAEAARDAAMGAQEDAEAAQGEAESDAMMELKIDGTMKSVGEVMIDATAPNNVITIGTGANRRVENTGLQTDATNPSLTVAEVTGVAFANTAGTPPNPNTPYRQAVAARTFDVGKVVDSADDMARLTIVTQYAGSKMVKVYALHGTVNGVTSTYDSGPAAARSGPMDEIFVGNGPDGAPQTADDVYARLHDAGMFYRVGPSSPEIGDLSDTLDAADQLAANAKPEQVYRYTVGGQTRYVVVTETETRFSPGRTRTLITHWHVDITAPAADANDDGTAEQVEITANLSEATDYSHIHFGVWAALDEDGEDPSAHGIGFVHNYSDEGMTAMMPNFGSATYNGNWVATVQVADPDGNGDISIADGTAMMTADFVDDDITVDLTGLAMLEGDISGNTFSGTKATVDATNTHRLTGGEDFTGSFEGAFYGVGAAEAGGVFDFGSDGNEDGAFVGAFGAVRE